MKLSGSEIIIKVLEAHGIDTVAGIPGGYILPFYDCLAHSKIRHVLVRHEQAAGFVAQGIARTTGKPAVCIATSGPGAINLLTAIADARCDSVPIIAITGQVNTSLIGTDAFQEGDTFGLSLPITKHSVMIKRVEDVLETLLCAFEIASSARPGPVLIDVPRDVQTAQLEVTDAELRAAEKRIADFYRFQAGRRNLFRTDDGAFAEKAAAFARELALSEKPVLYIGGGAQSPEAAAAIRAFRASYQVPVVTSLMGIGVVPSADTLGMVGMHGSYAANRAMYESDLVFVLGARFDDRAAGVSEQFCPHAKILHIDVDAAEIGKILPPFASLVYDVESALPKVTDALMSLANGTPLVVPAARTGSGDALAASIETSIASNAEPVASVETTAVSNATSASAAATRTKNGAGAHTANNVAGASVGSTAHTATQPLSATDIVRKAQARAAWCASMQALKAQADNLLVGRCAESTLPNPRAFIANVPALAAQCGIAPDDIIVTTDVGQHQMWTAQCYPITRPRQLLTSGSLGTMGFGLPAAVGAALAHPEKRVVCFSGDGSILMNVQELATLAEQNLDVTVIVLENGVLGMVRQQQKYLFSKTYSASVFPQNPDFVAVAQGFGIRAVDANADRDWYKTAFARGACLVRLRIDAEEDVLPFVKAGSANIDAIR